jgi:hypothetical protein
MINNKVISSQKIIADYCTENNLYTGIGKWALQPNEDKITIVGFKVGSIIRGSIKICELNFEGEIINDFTDLNLNKLIKLKEFL